MSKQHRGDEIDKAVHGMASLMKRSGADVLSAGDRADLRRLDVGRIDAAAFWKLEARFFDGLLSSNGDERSTEETDWASVIVGLAQLEDLCVRGARAGHALRDAGFSDARFVRLLRADRDGLHAELPLIARFMTAKGAKLDWSDLARLLLLSEDGAERQRRSLARDFYTEPQGKPTPP